VVQIYSFLSDSKLDSKTSLPPSVNFMAAIVFERPVRQMKWNPQRSRRLAICTLADDVRSSNGSSGIYFWDGEWEEEDSFAEADVAKQGVVEALHVPKREWPRTWLALDLTKSFFKSFQHLRYSLVARWKRSFYYRQGSGLRLARHGQHARSYHSKHRAFPNTRVKEQGASSRTFPEKARV
jgi:hypothetical protein